MRNQLDRIPFFTALDNSQNILISGAGGGFDIFCGLPLYFYLKNSGKNVHLGNLTFSPLDYSVSALADTLVEVTPDYPLKSSYAPELFLSRWFRSKGLDVPVYCFKKTGVKPLEHAYNVLLNKLNIDTMILIDGGTDSLMKGDESGLGTPCEDAASMAAVHKQDIPHKYLVCLGFGIDAFHGVCHSHFLENTASLSVESGFLGTVSIHQEMEEVQKYVEATQFVFNHMPDYNSIVNASIISAIEGHYGNYHRTDRTENSTLWINPLMTLYWTYSLEKVIEQNLYLKHLDNTETFLDVDRVIGEFRKHIKTKKWKNIPL